MSDNVFRDHLERLETTFRDNGETTLADLIRRIRTLPDPVAFLRKSLAPRNGRKKNDVSFREREAWFKRYTSQKGSKLSEKDIQALASLTCGWELEESEVRALHNTALLWIRCPSIFWEGKNCGNIIIKAFNDLQNDHIRRKVLLTTLSEYVQEQQNNISRDSVKSYSETDPESGSEARPLFYLKQSLGHITRLLWPHADDEEKDKNRTRLALFSRWGWKWRQLEHPGFILSISDTPHTCYEKITLTNLQRSALNSWAKTTRQFSVICDLDEAWKSITNRYRDGFATDNRQDVEATQSGQFHALSQLHCIVQCEVADDSPIPLTLPPLRQTQQTNTQVLPPLPLPVFPTTSGIPHRGPNPFQLSNQMRSLHPFKFSSLLSANSAATGNAGIVSSTQHTNPVQYSDSMSNLMGYDEAVPLQPGGPCRRQLGVANTESGIAPSASFSNHETNAVTNEHSNTARTDPTGSPAASPPALNALQSSHESGDYLIPTNGIPYSLPARSSVAQQYQPSHETLADLSRSRITVSHQNETTTGDPNRTLNSTACGEVGFPRARSHDRLGLLPDNHDRRSNLSPPQVDSRQLLDDLSGFYQCQQVNSDDLLADINTFSAPQVDSRQLLNDLSDVYQIQQANSSELLADINTFSAPQVDSRELLNDLGTSNLYQVRQVNSDELLDEIRQSSATTIDDMLREADDFTRSCEKESHQFIIPATLVS